VLWVLQDVVAVPVAADDDAADDGDPVAEDHRAR
jgi:hypothetical protein